MPFVTSHMSISLDGFVAGPAQSFENPLGVGGRDVHRWHIGDVAPEDQPWVDRLLGPRGAYLMGRNMFGPVRGDWESWTQGEWDGWWGPEPPYHAPVFVLTHHARDPIEMAGGTTFYFAETWESALEQAAEVAGDQPIDVAGGASTVRQALAAGVLDELVLDIAPVLLGAGERIFEGVTPRGFEPVEVGASQHATHVVYRLS